MNENILTHARRGIQNGEGASGTNRYTPSFAFKIVVFSF
jgi:hypothetical protein